MTVPAYGRIEQLASVVQLHLGLLCSLGVGSAGDREECDHAHHAVAAINDKNDQLWDDLLESSLVRIHEVVVRCGGASADKGDEVIAGVKGLHKWANESGTTLSGIIGPQCSGELGTVSNAEFRADMGGDRTTFLSPSSTGSHIADGAAYPNVIRLSTAETGVADALVSVMTFYGWAKVGLLYEHDDPWAKSSAADFVKAHEAWGGTILNKASSDCVDVPPEDGTAPSDCVKQSAGFSLHDFDEADKLASVFNKPENRDAFVSDLLTRLENVDARVIVLCVHPRVLRALLAMAYDQGRLLSNDLKGDYAWVATWVTEDALRNPDTTLNPSAVRGALGLLGVKEATDVTLPSYKEYTPSWAKVGTVGDDWAGSKQDIRFEQCGTNLTTIPGVREPPYCDADADAATLNTYSAQTVDAVVVWARAMNTIYRSDACAGGNSTAAKCSEALHDEVMRLYGSGGAYAGKSGSLDNGAGVSGPITLGPDGDRRGRFQVVNLQETGGDFVFRRQRRLAVTLGGRVEFVPIGTYDLATSILSMNAPLIKTTFPFVHGTRNGTDNEGAVFHGGTSVVPLDELPSPLPPPPPSPPPPCGDGGVDEALVWSYNISACAAESLEGSQASGSRKITFRWEDKEGDRPEERGCELPDVKSVACDHVPRLTSSGITPAITAVGYGVSILLLVAVALWHTGSWVDMLRKRGFWEDVVVTVGALALCAAPLALAGSGAGRCVAEPLFMVLPRRRSSSSSSRVPRRRSSKPPRRSSSPEA